MHRRSAAIAVIAALAWPLAHPSPAHSQQAGAPSVSSADASGMSAERLKRIETVFEKHVAEKRIAGAVTLVARHGRLVHLKAYGKQDLERDVPMATDTLFRIASMSKAITSVAAMMLIEEGALLLSDPVSKYLPAFKQTFVAVPPPPDAPAGTRLGTVPAKRAITIRDLMTHTAGVSYGAGPLEAEYKAAGIQGWYCADRDETAGQWLDRLASLPFSAQPGEQYVYGYGTDLLGRVVEVVSGQTLDEFFRARIFEPLRMRDTFFFVPPEKAARLATVYGARADGTVARSPEQGNTGQGAYLSGPRKCFSGGAGLVSTITDYARFLQMLANGGELDGARVLSPAGVASMTSNHVGTLYRNGDAGFGLGFEVVEHIGRAGRLTAAGEFSWGGAYYTSFWVDPADGLVAVSMTQLIPAGSLDLNNKFKSLVYQAIVTPGRETTAPVRSGRTRP
jgi:CubicO group peptidase (beta-lactamase class C family)